MNRITTTTRLADRVDEHPALARELEQRGLDYCCGGAGTLGAACERLGLDAAAVAAELTASTAPATAAVWRGMDAVGLVDHLVDTHHRYLWDELPRVTALAEKVLGVHGERHPELVAVAAVVAELRAGLEPHLVKEEQVLFPMIRELATADGPPSFHCGTLRNPFSVMVREHEEVGRLLSELRRQTDAYRAPVDACASYEALYAGLEELSTDTHLHIHKENNVLFPMVVLMEAELAGR